MFWSKRKPVFDPTLTHDIYHIYPANTTEPNHIIHTIPDNYWCQLLLATTKATLVEGIRAADSLYLSAFHLGKEIINTKGTIAAVSGQTQTMTWGIGEQYLLTTYNTLKSCCPLAEYLYLFPGDSIHIYAASPLAGDTYTNTTLLIKRWELY